MSGADYIGTGRKIMKGQWKEILLTILLALAWMAAGCSANATPPPPTQPPTSVPPTATQPPPTATQPPPTTTVAPDIVGTWLMKLLEGAGTAHLEFTKEGTYSLRGVDGAAKGATIDAGKFWFEGAQLKLESTGGCLDLQGKLISNCVATYRASVEKQGGKPTQLKLTVVNDPASDRKNTLQNKTLPWVEP
jgi:hypothetical protein